MADKIVNVTTAKAQWSRLLARVEGGEHITITRSGRPVADLVPSTSRRPRTPGTDEVVIHDNFDDPLPGFEEHA